MTLDEEALRDLEDAIEADPEAGLARVEALADASGADPELYRLAGHAYRRLGEPERAEAAFASAARALPDDPAVLVPWADALFGCLRFDEALTTARRAVELDLEDPEAHDVLGAVLERHGAFDDADRAFAAATRLEPERYPPIRRLSEAEFRSEMQAAAAVLPETFRARLDEVATSLEPVPPLDVLTAEEPYLEPEVLGLFVGVSLAERSHLDPGSLPPRIYLFQRNLERFSAGADDLREQIAITLYHELGHYLGLDEDELDAIDLA